MFDGLNSVLPCGDPGPFVRSACKKREDVGRACVRRFSSRIMTRKLNDTNEPTQQVYVGTRGPTHQEIFLSKGSIELGSSTPQEMFLVKGFIES